MLTTTSVCAAPPCSPLSRRARQARPSSDLRSASPRRIMPITPLTAGVSGLKDALLSATLLHRAAGGRGGVGWGG